MKLTTRSVNLEYAGMHGLYWMIYATVLNFAAVYLQARGYTNASIGVIMAAGNIAAFILQPLLASLADRSAKISVSDILLGICLVLGVCLVILLLVPGQSVLLSLVYAVHVCCLYVMQPFCNSFCLTLESWGFPVKFGAARGVGSLTFALVAVLMGIVVERSSAAALPLTALIVLVAFLALLLVFSVQSRKYGNAAIAAAPGSVDTRGVLDFLKANPRFSLVLLGCTAVYFPLSVFNSFAIQVVKDVGGTSAQMGAVVSFAAFLEIPVMFLFDRLLRRFRCSTLLKFSAVMFTLKAAAICFSTNMTMLFLSQFLHALSFAIFIPATVRYSVEMVRPEDAVKGQAYMTAMRTLSSIFAALLGGFMFDALGSFRTLFIGILVSLVGMFLILPGKRSPDRA